jgi:hypothetical protein
LKVISVEDFSVITVRVNTKKLNIGINKILIIFKCLLLCCQTHQGRCLSLDHQKSENKNVGIHLLGNYLLGRKNKQNILKAEETLNLVYFQIFGKVSLAKKQTGISSSLTPSH